MDIPAGAIARRAMRHSSVLVLEGSPLKESALDRAPKKNSCSTLKSNQETPRAQRASARAREASSGKAAALRVMGKDFVDRRKRSRLGLFGRALCAVI